jgi:hypothetical protein
MPLALAGKLRFGLLGCCALSMSAHAQYESDASAPVWFRALLDVRLVGAGPAPSWTDHGPGKMRYGGSYTDTGFERANRFVLSQAAVELGASLPWDLRAQVQLNIQPDIADGYRPWLVEATLRKEWGRAANGWGVQAGIMNPPFSLENTGPAWSPDFTVSASALNSWLWEDIRLTGLEGEWWHAAPSGLRLEALAGAGYGGDQVGRLLALRGWVLGDTMGGINGSLALPGRPDRADIFNERDQRPAVYALLSCADEHETAALRLGYFDNLGDQYDSGVWRTHFTTVGLTLHLPARVDVLAQYLDGVATVHSPPNDSQLSAYYVLVSHHYKQQRLSVRYDAFRVHDLDGGPVSTSERGHALTAAYQLQFGLRQRVAVEYTWMNSHRDATGVSNPTPEGWQVSYRFWY